MRETVAALSNFYQAPARVGGGGGSGGSFAGFPRKSAVGALALPFPRFS